MTLGQKKYGLIDPYLDALDSQDLESLLACFTQDAEFQLAGVTPVLVGKDALRSFYEERWHSFSKQHALRKRCFYNDLEVLTITEVKVTIPELGEGEFILPVAQRFIFDTSGLIAQLTDYLDLSSAVRAPRE